MYSAILDAIKEKGKGDKGKRSAEDIAAEKAYWDTLKNRHGQRWEKLKGQYAGGVKNARGEGVLDKRLQWLDWAEGRLGNATTAELVGRAAKKYGLNPGIMLASALEEGVGNRFARYDGKWYDISEAYENANKNGELKGYDVDGFLNYGIDTLGDRFQDLVRGGYLTQDFQSKFKPYKAKNEKGETVTTAAFVDDESAFMAKAAIMAQERDRMRSYLKSKGATVTPEEEEFLTLAAYNGGLGNAQKMLGYYQGKGLLGKNQFLQHRSEEAPQVYDNILPRIYGGRLFNGAGYFASPEQMQQAGVAAAAVGVGGATSTSPSALAAAAQRKQAALRGPQGQQVEWYDGKPFYVNKDGDLVAMK